MDIEAEKVRLIFELDNARRRLLDILKDADENRVVYPVSGWRVKDMVAHVLIWEEEALLFLRAMQKGERYTIVDFVSFESYNERAIATRRETPYDELKASLHAVRDEMKTILRALPPERFAGMVMWPWPWMGSLSGMIEVMVEHERSHAEEIRRALHESQ
jgi:hypothetical protein